MTNQLLDREKLKAEMIENAAEINRLHARTHETFKRRDGGEESSQQWQSACQEFHLRYEQLYLPGGPYPDFYDRIKAGDHDALEVALCFLEVRPYFFRSGYHWKAILQKCKSAPKSGEQAERFARLLEKYNEWKRLRVLGKQRGAAVRNYLWPLLRRFYDLFPVKVSDAKFDGGVTVRNLYTLLCNAMKIEPLRQPERTNGTARKPHRLNFPKNGNQGDIEMWGRNFHAWRESKWTPEDVWATLVFRLADAYGLDPSSR